jgi:glucan phosphoethanolaminetransferase (alkaline phosphatase superfamily)
MLLVSLLCYAGFTALCLSMDRHHADVLGRKPSHRLRLGLKLAGGLLLTLSLWTTVSGTGGALGLVEWFAVLMLSALLLVLLLPYRPRLALALAGLSLLVSPIAAMAQY